MLPATGERKPADLSAANLTFRELQLPSFLQFGQLVFLLYQDRGQHQGWLIQKAASTATQLVAAVTVLCQCAIGTTCFYLWNHQRVYLDEIHGCCRKITAIDKKSWVTEINKRNYHHLYKGASSELQKRLQTHRAQNWEPEILGFSLYLSAMCCAKAAGPCCSFIPRLFSYGAACLLFLLEKEWC